MAAMPDQMTTHDVCLACLGDGRHHLTTAPGLDKCPRCRGTGVDPRITRLEREVKAWRELEDARFAANETEVRLAMDESEAAHHERATVTQALRSATARLNDATVGRWPRPAVGRVAGDPGALVN